MPEIVMIVILLAIVYFLTMRKKAKENEKKPERPKFAPMPLEVTGDCWSCTPEELLDNVSLAVYQTQTMALPVYVFGQGYEVQDRRHWVTMLANPEGKLAHVTVTWCLDDELDIRKGASNYAGTLLADLANEECDLIIWEINRLTSQHEEGHRDELTRFSSKSRVDVSVGEEPKRTITLDISPIKPDELEKYRAEVAERERLKAEQQARAEAEAEAKAEAKARKKNPQLEDETKE